MSILTTTERDVLTAAGEGPVATTVPSPAEDLLLIRSAAVRAHDADPTPDNRQHLIEAARGYRAAKGWDEAAIGAEADDINDRLNKHFGERP